jgi:uncharacterized protein with HEPN domain
MRRDDGTRIQHMLDHAREATRLVRNRTRSDLDSDRMLNLALVRLMEVIGEAAARVSPELRASHAGIPWLTITGLRNRLIHGYDSVDFDVLWQILQDDLPPLIAQLEKVIDSA